MKKQQIKSTILIILLVLAFLTCLILASVLPFIYTFRNQDNVASAYHFIGGSFSDFEVGDLIYGIKVSNPSAFISSMQSSPNYTTGNASIDFVYDTPNDYRVQNVYIDLNITSTFCYLNLMFEDDSQTMGCNLLSWNTSTPNNFVGAGYFYFDTPVKLTSEYNNDTFVSSELWDNPYIQVFDKPFSTIDLFVSRFITPFDFSSQSIYINTSVSPTIPTNGFYQMRTLNDVYIYDYFAYKSASTRKYGVKTIGWTIVPSSTPNLYDATLSIGSLERGVKIYSCTINGSISGGDFVVSSVGSHVWYINSNIEDTPYYKYDLSTQENYLQLVNSEVNAPVIAQMRDNSTWVNWLALVDVFNIDLVDNNITWQSGFDVGYESGLDDGLTVGGQQGYNNGFYQGRIEGYNKGFIAGQKDTASNSYTFLGLLGAVVDAPIQALTGLLDFEIFGVNMSSFFISLIALAVIIIIIRVALGGK